MTKQEAMMRFQEIVSSVNPSSNTSLGREETWTKNFESVQETLNAGEKLNTQQKNWVANNKTAIRKGKMLESRRERFEMLDLQSRQVTRLSEQEKVALLERFVEEYDRMPKSTEKYEGFGIGAWCARTRKNLRQGQETE